MDSSAIGSLLLIQVILIALNAVFACAEIAILSSNETRLENMAAEGSKKAAKLIRLIRDPAKFLATIQVAITLSGFLGSAFAADNFSDVLVDWLLGLGLGLTLPRETLDTLAVIFITLVLSYFTLVFGELVPKRLAMKKPENISLAISGLISGISFFFAPIVWFLSVSTNLILRLLGIDPNQEDETVSEEEIRMMVDAGSKKGAIDHEEKEFIQNVFEFDDLTAGEIATHRTDVALLWLDDTMEEWARIIHFTRHTLYPICENSPDRIVGVLNAKDYFRLEDKSRTSVLRSAVRPAFFVSEDIKADVLFRSMKKTRNSMAVVLDEYGGMVGIVTVNDLLEQLVGDFTEDTSAPTGTEPSIRKTAEDTWQIFGNIELADIEEATGISFEDSEYDTLTGLIFNSLGVIPADGKQNIRLRVGAFSVCVTRIQEHQIAEASLQLAKSAGAAAGAGSSSV